MTPANEWAMKAIRTLGEYGRPVPKHDVPGLHAVITRVVEDAVAEARESQKEAEAVR